MQARKTLKMVALEVASRTPASASSSEDGNVLDLADDEGWEDLEPDIETVKVRCLLCAMDFDGIPSVLEHSKAAHSLDLVKVQKTLGG